jgi:hypothetical protein
MTDNKKIIINQFEENRGQFVIIGCKVFRLIGIGEDEMDYYYITYDGRNVHWHSAVGSYTVLKDKIDEKDYNELIRMAKLNHFDQPDFFSPQSDEAQKKQLEFAKSHKELMAKVNGDDKFIVPLCWDMN